MVQKKQVVDRHDPIFSRNVADVYKVPSNWHVVDPGEKRTRIYLASINIEQHSACGECHRAYLSHSMAA